MSRSFQTAALLAALASAPAAAGTRMTGGQQAVHRSASAAAGGESSGTGLRLLASVGEVDYVRNSSTHCAPVRALPS
jgi:hypothetical protein